MLYVIRDPARMPAFDAMSRIVHARTATHGIMSFESSTRPSKKESETLQSGSFEAIPATGSFPHSVTNSIGGIAQSATIGRAANMKSTVSTDQNRARGTVRVGVFVSSAICAADSSPTYATIAIATAKTSCRGSGQ